MLRQLRAFPLRAPSATIPCPAAHGPLLSRSELKRLKLLPRVARLLFVVPLNLTSPRRPETLSAGEGVPEAEDAGHKRGAGEGGERTGRVVYSLCTGPGCGLADLKTT